MLDPEKSLMPPGYLPALMRYYRQPDPVRAVIDAAYERGPFESDTAGGQRLIDAVSYVLDI